MKGVLIDIFCHNDQTRQSKNMDMHYEYQECDVSQIMFYNINALSITKDDDVEYACIHCNGDEFVSPLSFDVVKDLIEKNL